MKPRGLRRAKNCRSSTESRGPAQPRMTARGIKPDAGSASACGSNPEQQPRSRLDEALLPARFQLVAGGLGGRLVGEGPRLHAVVDALTAQIGPHDMNRQRAQNVVVLGQDSGPRLV